MSATFNLIDEPWIPCSSPDGRHRELGIRNVLERSHEIAEVRAQSPLVTAAIHQLLLAVLHRALDGPEDEGRWADLYKKGRWDAAVVADYLKRWHHCFDLFDGKRPFYQVAGFSVGSGDGEGKHVTKLAEDRAAGNNPTLFDHSFVERAASFPASVAARLLLANQAFALGGGVSGTSNLYGKHTNFRKGPMVGGVAFFLLGDSLFETLALNLLPKTYWPLESGPDDIPAWEREEQTKPEERRPDGYLDLLTWNSRCVRLIPDREDPAPPVTNMFYAQGYQLPRDTAVPLWRAQWAYREDPKKGPMPIRLAADKALWRDSHALFVIAQTDTRRMETRPRAFVHAANHLGGLLDVRRVLDCFGVGLATEPGKTAKAIMWRYERLPVPSKLLEDEALASELQTGLQTCEEAGSRLIEALVRMIRRLLSPDNPGGANPNEVSRTRSLMRRRSPFWASMETPFRRFLTGLPEDADAAVQAWHTAIRNNAFMAFDLVSDNLMARTARELRARSEGRSHLAQALYKLLNPEKES